MNYSDALTIDPMSLDKEWERQSNLYYQASGEASEAFENLTALKDYLNVKTSEIALQYRSGELQKMDSDDKPIKVTDKALDALLGADETLAKIKKEIREQKKVYDDAGALVSALEHKKKALENSVSLYLSGYFSEPRVKQSEGTTPSRDINDYATDKQREGLNSKKRVETKEAVVDGSPRRRRRKSASDDADIF